MPAESKTVEANPESVETCSRYEAARLDEYQLSVGLVDTPVEPLGGDRSVGTEGAEITVAKFHAFDQSLVPIAFVAFTLQ
jgi:hypothetical protein